ncbi:MAG: hypothetical protein QOE46_1731 [Acidobacteriota bacterium]|jgi:hypothetical protein|nr:hypothetical protein [Acidobacteriota bacterium]
MKKIFLFFGISLLALAPAAGGQTQPGGESARPARQRLVGEVTAVDPATHQVTVRADSGETVKVNVGEQTTYLRMPPGETKLEKGQPAAFTDVRVGDRVLAPGVSASGGSARQIILMARVAGTGGGARDDGRRLAGRVVSVDASKKLIVVQARGREGVEAVTIDASGDVRFLRFASDSIRPTDARPGSLADVKVGDTVRATGARATDGGPFKAEEVLSGSFTRFAGTVTNVDAARGELAVKNEQTSQTLTLSFGARSSLRRVTPEFEQAVAQQRAERAQRAEQRRASGEGGQAQGENRNGGREGRREGEGAQGQQQQGTGERAGGERRGGDGERRGGGPGSGARRGGGGGNFQQMFESLPSVALADLKKGDAVIITATPGADASHATVVSLVTGGAEFLRGLQQFGRGGEGQRGMSPGLPGDVIGNGQGGTREPPR